MLAAFYSDSENRSDAYALLRLAFRRIFGSACPEIAKTPEGKPYFPSRPDVFFSLSHTAGRVMVCLGSAPCGCDVERPRPVRESLVRYVCREEELQGLDFIELWTLKESCIKLRGHFIPFRDMVFRREGGTILTPYPETRARLYPSEGFMSAVCACESPPEELIHIPWKNLN